MANRTAPTKGNLMAAVKSLSLAKVGYELMDRKRNILMRELMALIEKAKEIQKQIDSAYSEAYRALEKANITLGFCDEISMTIPPDNSLSLDYRSIMGVEIPIIGFTPPEHRQMYYGLGNTNSSMDNAVMLFTKAKELTVTLAEVENSVYRLTAAIKKTQKRANALSNILIPRFEEEVKQITDALEEKDREEFSRMKVIKKQKED